MAPILECQDTTPSQNHMVTVQKRLPPLQVSTTPNLATGTSLEDRDAHCNVATPSPHVQARTDVPLGMRRQDELVDAVIHPRTPSRSVATSTPPKSEFTAAQVAYSPHQLLNSLCHSQLITASRLDQVGLRRRPMQSYTMAAQPRAQSARPSRITYMCERAIALPQAANSLYARSLSLSPILLQSALTALSALPLAVSAHASKVSLVMAIVRNVSENIYSNTTLCADAKNGRLCQSIPRANRSSYQTPLLASERQRPSQPRHYADGPRHVPLGPVLEISAGEMRAHTMHNSTGPSIACILTHNRHRAEHGISSLLRLTHSQMPAFSKAPTAASTDLSTHQFRVRKVTLGDKTRRLEPVYRSARSMYIKRLNHSITIDVTDEWVHLSGETLLGAANSVESILSHCDLKDGK
ncbi:MAG: hypothetical protein J3R72DRAFT_511038 [Linnemannia gamsii]|nr:MAG: hypothetical protein J3R72DRAFT_511038 [Linnemannia gamsii]